MAPPVGCWSLRINCNNSSTIPPTAVGRWLRSNLHATANRNNPTDCRRWDSWKRRPLCRLDLNYPPTPVGGIRHDPLLYLFLKDHKPTAKFKAPLTRRKTTEDSTLNVFIQY